MSVECFIGITSWNSAAFLKRCLDQLVATTRGRAQIVVWDNMSSDESVAVAKAHGVQVVVRAANQPNALNGLLALSSRPYTLLIHSDVVMLDEQWLNVCISQMTGDVALLSPEDIGCGPYTRPWGRGMPESSFMFFETAKARLARGGVLAAAIQDPLAISRDGLQRCAHHLQPAQRAA